MKTQKNKLSFNKNTIVMLQNDYLIKIKGGSGPKPTPPINITTYCTAITSSKTK